LLLSPGESIDKIPGYKVCCSERVRDLTAFAQMFIAGGMGGIGYWAFVYPIDVVKTVMQTDSLNKAQRQHAGMLDAARAVYRCALSVCPGV
jgi:hypothetical protein